MNPTERRPPVAGGRLGLQRASFAATVRPQHVIERRVAGDDRLAEAQYRRQIAGNPDHVDAIQSLAVLLGTRGEYEEAARLLEHALRLRPQDPHLHNDMGVTLERAGEFARAAASYREALRLAPEFPQIRTNLANALLHGGDAEGALEECQSALRLAPSYAPALNILGSALVDTGRAEEALVAYRRAIAISPDHAETRTNYGMALLQDGDFENGWNEYEWRRRLPDPIFRRAGPTWDGSVPAGKTLFVYGEGGLGNVIQFARYIPLLHDRGAKVVVECQNQLTPLLASMPGNAGVVPRGARAPHYDAHVPLASLPALFATRLETIPARIPYIHLDPAVVEKWRAVVDATPWPRIGVCWRGSQAFQEPHSRSFAPSNLRPLVNLPGVNLINLQYDQPAPVEPQIHVLPGLDLNSMQFIDVAAVVCHLDLVISCDTSIAHLAGALGKPVWVALRYAASWRWMQSREDSPWYPTMRLFRQSRPDDWTGVFEGMAGELAALVQAAATIR